MNLMEEISKRNLTISGSARLTTPSQPTGSISSLRWWRLRADGRAEGVGQGLAEALDVGIVFGFDHDAGELLGAGVAKDDAAILAESELGFGQGAGDFR